MKKLIIIVNTILILGFLVLSNFVSAGIYGTGWLGNITPQEDTYIDSENPNSTYTNMTLLLLDRERTTGNFTVFAYLNFSIPDHIHEVYFVGSFQTIALEGYPDHAFSVWKINDLVNLTFNYNAQPCNITDALPDFDCGATFLGRLVMPAETDEIRNISLGYFGDDDGDISLLIGIAPNDTWRNGTRQIGFLRSANFTDVVIHQPRIYYRYNNCTIDANCSVGEFCKTDIGRCASYNINGSVTFVQNSSDQFIYIVPDWDNVSESEDYHLLYKDGGLHDNASATVDSWKDYVFAYGTTYTYQLIAELTGDVVGKSPEYTVIPNYCSDDQDCIDVFGAGWWCSANNTCMSPDQECQDDADCQSYQFCDRYSYIYIVDGAKCVNKSSEGEQCTHDNMCLTDDCQGEATTATWCNYQENDWQGACDITLERCESDWYCNTWGACYNGSINCTYDNQCNFTGTICQKGADGSDNCHCDITTEGTDEGYCELDTGLPWGFCERDAWCMNASANQYNVEMFCLDNTCTPYNWGCSWYATKNTTTCGSDKYCNWSLEVYLGYGDHMCYLITALGGNCTTDVECGDNATCIGGQCVPVGEECLYNNPDKYGNSNPNYPASGYCDGITEQTTSHWCFVDSLTYTGGLANKTPDHTCYLKKGVGQSCDYDYQCLGLSCEYRGDTKICVGTALTNQTIGFPHARISGKLSGCDESVIPKRCPAGNPLLVYAYFHNDTGRIDATACVAYSNGFYQSPINLPVEFDLGYYGSGTFGNTTGNFTFYVICTAGCGTLTSISYNYEVVDENSTILKWIYPFNETFTAIVGEIVRFKVMYETIQGVPITGATCSLTLDGSTHSLAQKYTNQGIYENKSVALPSTEGVYSYSATCSKSGEESRIIYGRVTLLPNHCNNGVRDYDETGVDCGGNCPPCQTSDCNNGIQDGDETGVDCGGNCPPCPTDSDCYNGVQDGSEIGVDCGGSCPAVCCIIQGDLPYTIPFNCGTCTDVMWNGNETGIDCGGRCIDLLGDYCSCGFIDSVKDCYPYDGSYVCNGTAVSDWMGICIPQTCTSDTDCYRVKDKDNVQYRNRTCDTDGWCRFGEFLNATSNYSAMIIKPLSGLIYNRTLYIGTCESETNGFIIETNKPTLKQYFIGSSAYSPSIPADDMTFGYQWKVFGDDDYKTSTSGIIDKMCYILSSENRSYSNITFMACILGGSNNTCDYQSIDALIFRHDFRANSTFVGSGGINFTLNRWGSCFGKMYSGSAWIAIGNGTSMQFNYSAMNYSRLYWLCNSSYGENKTGDWKLVGFGLFNLLVQSIFPNFTWRGWMLIPIGWVVFVVIPLIIAMILKERAKDAS